MKKLSSQHLILACHQIPHIVTAITETVYNAIDAQASAIKLYLNLPHASFSVIDNGTHHLSYALTPPNPPFSGNGFKSDSLFNLRHEESASESHETAAFYGANGAFLSSLIAVADVEIESRARDEWIVYRKVFKNAEVTFNGRDTLSHRSITGVTISVKNLFGRLPIRRRLLGTSRYQQSALTSIRNFFQSLSLIWPKISFEIICENANAHSNRIGAFHIDKVDEYLDRLVHMFGSTVASQLQSISHATMEFSVCGYFGITVTELSSRHWQIIQTSKHARNCYQYAFLNNRPHANFQAQVSRVISKQIAKTCDGCLVVFVLAFQAGRDAMDVIKSDTKNGVIFASHDTFQAFMTQVTKMMISRSSIYREILESDELVQNRDTQPLGTDGLNGKKRRALDILKEERRLKSKWIDGKNICRSRTHSAQVEVKRNRSCDISVIPPPSVRKLECLSFMKAERNDPLTRLKIHALDQVLFPSASPAIGFAEKVKSQAQAFSSDIDEIRNAFVPAGKESLQRMKRLCLKCQKVEPSSSTIDLNLSVMHLPNVLQARKVSKSIFDRLFVLGQVDKKFILASTRLRVHNADVCMIVAFDQHAVDERIKLEKLEKTLLGLSGTERNIERYHHCPGLKLWMNAQEDRALHVYEKTLDDWGFYFERISHDKSKYRMKESIDGTSLILKTSPKFDGRVATETDFREFVNYLLEEYATTEQIPPMISRLIKSRACRSAIMFGEWLSHAECQRLLSDLSRCSLPFQCAHGRSSIAPLAEYQDLDSN
uniref:Uncharacterized protein AlNc14C308G10466 n=1 Tax=Albugo laibachii Nc14 TaxID=890382 RepID=F0WW16_9STRA|nr:hypothetical protein PITG_07252 [Albugo laibachii Nc14]|eukprot:CCA25619.1 hypothetical protein PITG_07252 [Albugo laibachii Nc14]